MSAHQRPQNPNQEAIDRVKADQLRLVELKASLTVQKSELMESLNNTERQIRGVNVRLGQSVDDLAALDPPMPTQIFINEGGAPQHLPVVLPTGAAATPQARTTAALAVVNNSTRLMRTNDPVNMAAALALTRTLMTPEYCARDADGFLYLRTHPDVVVGRDGLWVSVACHLCGGRGVVWKPSEEGREGKAGLRRHMAEVHGRNDWTVRGP
ncbi:hypothetical protein NA57DRAFT_54883 [Rhizodiscina lignyota]|uniref:Uncharacterized protein n=1 Tax=Rhizodiscina lignyota TaxID=1504668 RepID=A0A9P4M889_9PEZI|nr:hypothetical protein NA57DRAFT_54883 [Rhizodiscina lignyota]